MPEPSLDEMMAELDGMPDDLDAAMAELDAMEAQPESKVIEMPVQQIEGRVQDPTNPLSPQHPVGNAINQLGRGLTLGGAPYIEAGWRKLTQGGDYGEHLANIQGGLAEGERRHPVSSFVAQAAGGAATAGLGAAAAPARLAPQLAMGATQGAVTGALESGGDPASTILGAQFGATGAGRGKILADQGAAAARRAAAAETRKMAEQAARKAAAQAAAERAARVANGPPPVMDSLRYGARRTAELGRDMMPVVAGEIAAQAIPQIPPGAIFATRVAAPMAFRGTMATMRGLRNLGAEAVEKAGPQLGQVAAQQVANQAARATGGETALERFTRPSAAKASDAKPPEVEVEIGEARPVSPSVDVEIGEARQLPSPRAEVEIGEARDISRPQYDVSIGEATVRRLAQQRMQGRQIDSLRTAYVGRSMSPELRTALGTAIESGDAKAIAAAMEDAQRDPRLANEMQKLRGGN